MVGYAGCELSAMKMNGWNRGVIEMAKPDGDLRVGLAPGVLLPQAFRWEGRSYRVLAVHSIKTRGLERRYRVASSAGYFELALNVSSDTWRVRHAPNWLSRAWYQWQNGPRYPLPAWRRRKAWAHAVRRPQAQPAANPGSLAQVLAQTVAGR